jgi:hypothetical protein
MCMVVYCTQREILSYGRHFSPSRGNYEIRICGSQRKEILLRDIQFTHVQCSEVQL